MTTAPTTTGPTTPDPTTTAPTGIRNGAAPGPERPTAGLRRPGGVLVLTARPARRREPSATVWRLLDYDPATRTPVADIAQRWQPVAAPQPPAGPGAGPVPAPVAEWVAAVLGPHAAIGPPADTYAGPDSWHVHTPAPGGAD